MHNVLKRKKVYVFRFAEVCELELLMNVEEMKLLGVNNGVPGCDDVVPPYDVSDMEEDDSDDNSVGVEHVDAATRVVDDNLFGKNLHEDFIDQSLQKMADRLKAAMLQLEDANDKVHELENSNLKKSLIITNMEQHLAERVDELQCDIDCKDGVIL